MELSALKQRVPEGTFFGVLFAERTVLTIFKGSKVILSAAGKPFFYNSVADINLMLAYSVEHDSKLRQCAPLFFQMCVPGLSEEHMLQVFYQTSRRDGFALRCMIVTKSQEPTLSHLQKYDAYA